MLGVAMLDPQRTSFWVVMSTQSRKEIYQRWRFQLRRIEDQLLLLLLLLLWTVPEK
jgi:hypothetical protein